MINDTGKADFTIDEIASYTGADPVLIGKAAKNLEALADHCRTHYAIIDCE